MTLDDFIENLTKEQAEFIRNLRTGIPMHSWRRIAHLVSDQYDVKDCTWEHEAFGEKVIDGNQLVGMEMCRYAAKLFGEDYQEEPWN